MAKSQHVDMHNMQMGLRRVSALHGMRDNPFTRVQRSNRYGRPQPPRPRGASRQRQTSLVGAGFPSPADRRCRFRGFLALGVDLGHANALKRRNERI
jgi:hypothetical protein